MKSNCIRHIKNDTQMAFDIGLFLLHSQNRTEKILLHSTASHCIFILSLPVNKHWLQQHQIKCSTLICTQSFSDVLCRQVYTISKDILKLNLKTLLMRKCYAPCEQSPAPCSLAKGGSHRLTTAQAWGGRAKPKISCTCCSSAPSHLASGKTQDNLRQQPALHYQNHTHHSPRALFWCVGDSELPPQLPSARSCSHFLTAAKTCAKAVTRHTRGCAIQTGMHKPCVAS